MLDLFLYVIGITICAVVLLFSFSAFIMNSEKNSKDSYNKSSEDKNDIN